MAKLTCEGIIPERTEPTHSEMVETDEPGVFKMIVHSATTPEHPCEREATMVQRSLKQTLCNLGGLHWVQDGPDHAFCTACFRPGTVTTAEGRVTAHPAMAIDEYKG